MTCLAKPALSAPSGNYLEKSRDAGVDPAFILLPSESRNDKELRARFIDRILTLMISFRIKQVFGFLSVLVVAIRIHAAADANSNWPQFRGPNASGVAANARPPLKINS